jgi:polyisoprenoid-binding protein YceI
MNDYMASEKYQKAGFKGKILKISSVNFSKDGIYNVSVNGDLTIKDVTTPATAQGTICLKNGAVTVVSQFTVQRPRLQRNRRIICPEKNCRQHQDRCEPRVR